jgi:hypothetical protein
LSCASARKKNASAALAIAAQKVQAQTLRTGEASGLLPLSSLSRTFMGAAGSFWRRLLPESLLLCQLDQVNEQWTLVDLGELSCGVEVIDEMHLRHGCLSPLHVQHMHPC